MRRYYTPQEVAEHDTAENCWVSFFGKVYDLTPLLDANKGVLAQPIIDHAGQDLTHWFDAVTRDVKVHVNPATELRVPYTPMGRFIHIPPPEPTTDWVVDFEKPWWKVRPRLAPRASRIAPPPTRAAAQQAAKAPAQR
jgi:hypothetical protein